jgi:hypothetical protein
MCASRSHPLLTCHLLDPCRSLASRRVRSPSLLREPLKRFGTPRAVRKEVRAGPRAVSSGGVTRCLQEGSRGDFRRGPEDREVAEVVVPPEDDPALVAEQRRNVLLVALHVPTPPHPARVGAGALRSRVREGRACATAGGGRTRRRARRGEGLRGTCMKPRNIMRFATGARSSSDRCTAICSPPRAPRITPLYADPTARGLAGRERWGGRGGRAW